MRNATEIDCQIGARIRFARKARKISLIVLSRSLGISIQQMQKYETGANRISAGRLLEVAKILEVSVVSFYGEYASAGKGTALSGEAIELALSFDRLPSSRLKQSLYHLVLSALDDAEDENRC